MILNRKHDKYDLRGIYHVRTNRKDDIFMQRRLVQSFTYILELGRGTCTLTKHTRRWTFSALRHFLVYPLALINSVSVLVGRLFVVLVSTEVFTPLKGQLQMSVLQFGDLLKF